MSGRLLFDVSTSMRWSGPPVGIVRVERELARWAAANDPNCHFVFFDGQSQRYREITYGALQAFLEGTVAFDTTGMKDPSRSKPRKTDRVPSILLGTYLWIAKFRRLALRTLGELVLQTRSETINAWGRRAMRVVAGKKYKKLLAWSDNPNRVFVRPGFFSGRDISFEAGDRIFFAGSNWTHSNVRYIADQKRHCDFDLITLCYDIIPLVRPHFYKVHDVEIFRDHYHAAFAISSLVLVTSRIVGDDIRAYCEQHRIPTPEVKLIPLGVDLPQRGTAIAARASPRSYSRYIMLVSTIEPRKGHRLIHSVWSKLIEEGIPQRLDVTLVLVGRPGWLVDELMVVLSASERVVILDEVNDDELAELYDGADFCIYPSEYEGYGLPIVEALARQRAVIASSVGVVPELEGDLLRRLPYDDERAWLTAIREWLLAPPDRRMAKEFRHPTWQEVASIVFATIHGQA